MSTKGVHNGSLALHAKVAMREKVLELVSPARVFDAFCGPDGEMWQRVWRRAASYIGCDEEYKPFDQRRRFVGDNRRVMRAIDLQAFNVFDLDAFGEPWEQFAILMARRTWARGERGAIVLTWSSVHLRMRWVSHALGSISGVTTRGLREQYPYVPMALRRFMRHANVRPVESFGTRGDSEPFANASKAKAIFDGGTRDMAYLAVVFDGLGAAN